MDLAPVIFFQAMNGLIWGLITALLAVGLNLVFGLLGIVNVAQGALYMLGAIVCWQLSVLTGSYTAGLVGAVVIVALIGFVIERTLLQRIAHDHDTTIILTVGLAFVIEQGAQATIGSDVRTFPGLLPGSLVQIAGFGYPLSRLLIAGIAILVLAGLWLFLHRTRFGLWTRAVRYNPSIARAVGIPAPRVYSVIFVLGVALAALGGALAAPILSVRPDMGNDILATAFIVVVLGGLGNLPGSVAIAILICVTEGIGAIFLTPVETKILTLCILVLVMLARPRGIFERNRLREA